MEDFGKLLIGLGILVAIIGVGLMLIGKIPGIGRLPGDIIIQRDNFTCFFPLATSIILSIVLTIILNFVIRFINK